MIPEHELTKKLEPYLPPGTAPDVASWIIKTQVHFRITMPRNSVFGDYMHPHDGKGHRITINGNLNMFAFLVTTIHEFAHLYTFEKYGNRVKPHGLEWKEEFKRLMSPYLHKTYLPVDVNDALAAYMKNPAASSCNDHHLMLTLKQYDREKSIYLEEVPEGTTFKIQGMTLIKGKKRRTRYECMEVKSRSLYLVGQSAEIFPL